MRVQGNEELRLAEQSNAGPETGRRRTGAEVWRERVGARVVARVVARARVQAAARTRARSWEMRCRRTLAALKAARLAGVAAEQQYVAGWKRSYHQRMFHDDFLKACTRTFWKTEPPGSFARDHAKVLEANSWEHLTISVSMFAAAILFAAPSVE